MSGMTDVLYLRAQGQGWGPVDELATLASTLLHASLITVEDRGELSPLHKIAGQLPRRRGRSRALLVIASSPAHLAYAARFQHWLPGYATTAAWVIDSFWTDRLSRMARHRGHFDHIFITDRDLQDDWRSATGSAVHWAPWGTDTMAIDHTPPERSVDLVRIGRQPPAWDDDDLTASMAERLGLVVEGRPPFHSDPARNQNEVRSALRRAKFVLAFSNRVSPADYTHPTREYLTGRWTDALGAGTTVAGAAPASSAYTLWPEATIELDPHDLERGLGQLRRAVDLWSPSVPQQQHEKARGTLDWRWRLQEIAEVLGLTGLEELDRAILELQRKSGAP